MASTPDLLPPQSLLSAAAKIVKDEGISGLYAGLNSSLIGVGVSNLCVAMLARWHSECRADQWHGAPPCSRQRLLLFL